MNHESTALVPSPRGAAVKTRTLTEQQRGALNEVPAEVEWLANIANEKTRRAYENDVSEFSTFMGIMNPESTS
jgi:hypothetical protein